MSALFLSVCNLSIAASVTAGIILLLRLLFRRYWSKRAIYLLWGLVLLRLCLPVSLSSAVSLFGLWQTPATAAETRAPLSSMQFVRPPAEQGRDRPSPSAPPANANPPGDGSSAGQAQAPASGTQAPAAPDGSQRETAAPALDWTELLAWIWAGGALLLFCAGAGSYGRTLLRLRRAVPLPQSHLLRACKQATGVHRRVRLYRSTLFDTPVVVGVLRPRIVLPASLDCADETALGHILSHELCHLRRWDNFVKPASLLLLCLHWFNPVLWLCHLLAGRDMESACDETVLRCSPYDIRQGYAATLLSVARSQQQRAGVFLAFGESNLKKRILDVLRFRKRTLLSALTAVCVCLLAGCTLLTNPTGVPSTSEPDASASQPSGAEQDAPPDTEPVWLSLGRSAGQPVWTEQGQLLTVQDRSLVWLDTDGQIVKTVPLEQPAGALGGKSDEIEFVIGSRYVLLANNTYTYYGKLLHLEDDTVSLANLALYTLDGKLVREFPSIGFDSDAGYSGLPADAAHNPVYNFSGGQFYWLDEDTLAVAGKVEIALYSVSRDEVRVVQNLRPLAPLGKQWAYLGFQQGWTSDGVLYFYSFNDAELTNQAGTLYAADWKNGGRPLFDGKLFAQMSLYVDDGLLVAQTFADPEQDEPLRLYYAGLDDLVLHEIPDVEGSAAQCIAADDGMLAFSIDNHADQTGYFGLYDLETDQWNAYDNPFGSYVGSLQLVRENGRALLLLRVNDRDGSLPYVIDPLTGRLAPLPVTYDTMTNQPHPHGGYGVEEWQEQTETYENVRRIRVTPIPLYSELETLLENAGAWEPGVMPIYWYDQTYLEPYTELIYLDAWERPEDIPVSMFGAWYREHINQQTTVEERNERYGTGGQGWRYPAAEFEAYVQTYFDLSAEHLRTAEGSQYDAASDCYLVNGGGLGEQWSWRVESYDDVWADGSRLSLLLRRTAIDTNAPRGAFVLTVDRQPDGGFHYVSCRLAEQALDGWGDDDTSRLLQLEQVTDETLADFSCQDFDGDGSVEAFALTCPNPADASSDEMVPVTLWFISKTGVTRLEDIPQARRYIQTLPVEEDALICIPFPGDVFGYYGVRDGEAYRLKISGRIGYLNGIRKGEYSVLHYAYDSGESSAEGLTTKTYWFYYEDGEFTEYGAIEIDRQTLETAEGAAAYLQDIEDSGFVLRDILYRGNGIIHVNTQDTYGNNLSFAFLYDPMTRSLEQWGQYDGVYLPALVPEAAAYPEAFPQ